MHAAGGEEAFKAKPISGRPPNLGALQIKWLSRILIDKTPHQLNFPFALWTRGLILDNHPIHKGAKVKEFIEKQ